MKRGRLPMEPDLPPSRMEIIGRELNDLAASMGEIRLALNALRERVERLERERMRGGIAGQDGEWSITPPPEFEYDGVYVPMPPKSERLVTMIVEDES